MRDRDYRKDENREDPLIDMGYETQDLDLPQIGKATIGFFLFFFISIGIAWAFLRWPVGFESGFGLATNTDRPNRIPAEPSPLLQSNVTTRTDIMQMRQEESLALHSTERHKDGGTYRIPIDRAMDIIAQRGLPKTTGPVDIPQYPRTSDVPSTQVQERSTTRGPEGTP